MSIHQATRDRLEDLEWMAETGECLTGAARRLQLTPAGVEKFCQRQGRLDLFRTLAARETVAAWRPNSYARRKAS